jgi:hypothetical protein
MTQRLKNSEQQLHQLLNELIATRQTDRIRILSDDRLAGNTGADMLIQVDDYDIRLLWQDTPNHTPELQVEQLPVYLQLLEANPSTLALILVWTLDELPAVALSVARIHFLMQNPDRSMGLAKNAKPLTSVLRDLVSKQMRVWDIGLEPRPRSTAKPTDIHHLFIDAIVTAIETERHRSYRHTERKRAARNFPADEEKQIVLKALNQALNGAAARDLVPMLTRVVRKSQQ